jgi:hypothetical protein
MSKIWIMITLMWDLGDGDSAQGTVHDYIDVPLRSDPRKIFEMALDHVMSALKLTKENNPVVIFYTWEGPVYR